MYCNQCGAKLDDDSNFCCKCGSPTHPQQKDSIDAHNVSGVRPAPSTQQTHAPSAADDGSIMGILGFAFSFAFPLLGLIFSIIGLSKNKYRGFAKAGLIISIVYMALVVIIVIAALTSSSHYYYYYRYI